MLRIIAGKFRSRKLLQPSLNITRSTKDRVREAIFSAIGNHVVNAVVLDLFAGSGAYGIEAISRGAKFAYLNDLNIDAVKIIETNINLLSIDQIKVSQLDGLDFVRNAIENRIQFDVIFLDPPYAYLKQETLFLELFNSNLLKPKGIVIYENESNHHYFNQDNFTVKSYNYGRTYVHIGWKQK